MIIYGCKQFNRNAADIKRPPVEIFCSDTLINPTFGVISMINIRERDINDTLIIYSSGLWDDQVIYSVNITDNIEIICSSFEIAEYIYLPR